VSKNHRDDDKTQTHIHLTKDTMVGHYRIVEKIGAGGMGEVYLAEDTKLNRTVALKFLSPFLSQDEDQRKRFAREAQAAAKLGHANIVAIHEVGDYRGRPWISMENVEGASLELLIESGGLGEDRIIDIAIGVCNGLRKAHETGIIHRDIKPSNILIDRDGCPRVLDFGLAVLRDTDRLTQNGSTLGTVGYMSPEQVEGKEVDPSSDLFSLGVVLYELFTGCNPFRRDNQAATLNAILRDDPQPITRYKSEVSDGLQHIILKMLQKRQEHRYQSAAGVIEDLRRLRRELEHGHPAEKRQPSIAVLPFANLSADPEQEYFCDGMAEEIINALAHIENLRFIARTSAFAFKGKHEDVRVIGRKLDVETLLEGSVRKAGNRLRITAQLVKVSDGSHFWSERYDRDMEDVFAIQDEISLTIVDKLKGKLLGEEKAALVKRYTENLEAYNLYLEGNYFSQMWTNEGFEKAIECFELALEKDPNYALAYAGIAYVYFFRAYFGNFPPKKAIPKAKTYLKKALGIDENLAEAHALFGKISTMYDWNWVLAEQEFRRALELNPNSSNIHLHYCDFLSVTGQHEEAIIEVKRARELDPLSININANVGERMYFAGQFDRAIEDLQKTIAMDRNWFYSHLLLGLSYLGKSMSKESIVELEKASDFSGGAPLVVVKLASTYYRIGKETEAEKLFNSLKERAKDEYIPSSFLFTIHKVRGDRELAFKWLERACEDRDIYLPYHLLPQPEDDLIIPYDKKSTELLKNVGLIK